MISSSDILPSEMFITTLQHKKRVHCYVLMMASLEVHNKKCVASRNKGLRTERETAKQHSSNLHMLFACCGFQRQWWETTTTPEKQRRRILKNKLIAPTKTVLKKKVSLLL